MSIQPSPLKFRRYADGSVVYEQDFAEYDNGHPYYDDYSEHWEHELKTHREAFTSTYTQRKRFEIRKNDRAYAVGDRLRLREHDAARAAYTGREMLVDVTYLSTFAQRDNHVVLGIRELDK